MKELEVICPVCEIHKFEEDDDYSICPICGWENDGVQRKDKNYSGGANDLSVNQSKKVYALLNSSIKKEVMKQLIIEYDERRNKIRSKYANINHMSSDGDKWREELELALNDFISLVDKLEKEEVY